MRMLKAPLLHLCRLGEGTRKAVKGWGLELLCKEPRWTSDALTVVETPKVGALSLADPLLPLPLCSQQKATLLR